MFVPVSRPLSFQLEMKSGEKWKCAPSFHEPTTSSFRVRWMRYSTLSLSLSPPLAPYFHLSHSRYVERHVTRIWGKLKMREFSPTVAIRIPRIKTGWRKKLNQLKPTEYSTILFPKNYILYTFSFSIFNNNGSNTFCFLKIRALFYSSKGQKTRRSSLSR